MFWLPLTRREAVSVPAAFIITVMIWATTPLAIKWSGESSFLFGVTSRIAIGVGVCVLILLLLRRPLPWRNGAWKAYVSAAVGIYGSLGCVYWAAQMQSSGMISVMFGLTSLVTSGLAYFFLREQSLGFSKVMGMGLGVVGLWVIFSHELREDKATLGIIILLFAVFLHGLSTVMVKKVSASLDPVNITTGGLLIALPLYLITWFFGDSGLPQHLSWRELISILYLGVFGSVIGFLLYYYILRNSSASRAGLIPLVTPVAGVWLGVQFNGESLSGAMLVGSVLILLGLALHHWGLPVRRSR